MTMPKPRAALSRWHLYGLSIDAPFPLPGAAPADNTAEPDLTIGWSPGVARVPEAAAADGTTGASGGPLLWEAPDGASALVWPGEMGLHYAADGRSLHIVSQPGKLTYVPTVLVGIGLGWLLQRRGQICLHGTALAWQGRAVGVLGPSGAGKSTLATALAQRGAQLLTDDVIVLRGGDGGLLVEPGCTSIRMHPDTAAQRGLTDVPTQLVPWTNKQLWQPRSELPTEAVRLDRLVLLAPVGAAGPSPTLRPLSPTMALRQLTQHCYPPQLLHRLHAQHFRRLAYVVQQHPVHEVRYAHDWSHLQKLADLLMPEVG
jgi:hypothetical protein